MKKLLSTIACAFAFMMLIGSLAVPALSATNSTNAPEWEVGDKWAYGFEADMGTEFSTYINDVKDMITGGLENASYNGTLNSVTMDGSYEAWMLFEISESSDDTYVMTMAYATELDIEGSIKMTLPLPAAGTYTLVDLLNAELEDVVVQAEASMRVAVLVTLEITMEKDTMAIEEILLNVSIDASADVTADNIPSRDFNLTTLNTTIEYTDYDMSADINANLAMDLNFTPALDMWDFPIVEGEEWMVYSNATLSGSLTGTIDAEGIPDELREYVFTEAFVNATGISDFPIVLEQIPEGDHEDGWPLDEGQMEERTEEVEIGLECTDVFTVDDDYWGNITVYEIAVEDSPMFIYYSPDVSLVSYFSMSTDDIEDLMDLDDDAMPSEDYQMEAVDPEVAEDHISEISGLVEDDDGGIASFFTEAPYLGIILVAVIVVVIVAAVVLIRKKK